MENHFQTTDLNLAAAVIVTANMYPTSYDRSDPARVRFIFEGDQPLNGLEEMFWKRELAVEPQGFVAAQRYLKAKVFEVRKASSSD